MSEQPAVHGGPSLYRQLREALSEAMACHHDGLAKNVARVLLRFKLVEAIDCVPQSDDQSRPKLGNRLGLGVPEDEAIVSFVGHLERMLEPLIRSASTDNGPTLAELFGPLYRSLLRCGEETLAHDVARRAHMSSEDRINYGHLVAELVIEGPGGVGTVEQLRQRVERVNNLAYGQRWPKEPLLYDARVLEAYLQVAWRSVGYCGDPSTFLPKHIWKVWSFLQGLPESYWCPNGAYQPLVPRMIATLFAAGIESPDYQLDKLMVWELVCRLDERWRDVASTSAAARITESGWGSVTAAVNVYWWAVHHQQHHHAALDLHDQENLRRLRDYLERCNCTGT